MSKMISIRNTIQGNVPPSHFSEASVKALGHFHWRPSKLQASLHSSFNKLNLKNFQLWELHLVAHIEIKVCRASSPKNLNKV